MAVHDITSPLPGTVYLRDSPTSPAYVQVGQRVDVGDTVALVEVMKMFTAVTADQAGTVTEILVEAEDIVNIGDVLVQIETD